MITTANKQRILEAIATNRANYPSDAKHAAALGISASVYNSLKKGQTDKALSDANWVNIARRLDVNLRDSIEWKGARTATFDYITTQLEACQERSLSVILCDLPNIGKTYTARWYVNEHRNAVYIDCSQVKTKRALVKKIANEFGVPRASTRTPMRIWFTICARWSALWWCLTKPATLHTRLFLNSKPFGTPPKCAAAGI